MNRTLLARLDKLEPKKRKAIRPAMVLHVREAHYDEDRAMLLKALADAGRPYIDGAPLLIIGVRDQEGYPILGPEHCGVGEPGVMP